LNKLAAFSLLVQDDIREVETLMRSQAQGYHPDLNAALDLILKSGGKRIRPSITMLIGRILGASHERLVIISSAIELLHTATLVHDDLIDGALLRRGMPTLNSQWSPGATVLTGDFLFARAAKLAADSNSIPVMNLFAKTLTIIVNGEITQLFTSRCIASREDYERRIFAKTASLFETSAASAALLSEASQHIVQAMNDFGRNIGMAFQMIDDILDFSGEQATLGKPVGSDLRQGLITLPALLYFEQHPEDDAAQEILSGKCVEESQRVNVLIESIRSGDSIRQARVEARKYIDQALESLAVLPASIERSALEELANYIVDRDF